MLRRVMTVALGTSWFLGFFWLGLVLTFPREDAANRVKYEVADATGDSMMVELEGIGPWAGTGAKAKALELYSVPRRGEPTRLFRAESVAARLQVLPLFTGWLSAGVDAELYDGTLSGSVGQKEEVLDIELLAKDLDLSLYPFEWDSFSSEVSGRLRLRVDLLWDPEDVTHSDGLVRLEVTDLALDETSVGGFFTLPSTAFTEAVLSFTISDGKARVKKGSFQSDLVQLDVDGDISLRTPFSRSTMNLTVDFKLGDDLDGMAKLIPDLKRARDEEGTYHYRVTGTVERRRFTPVRQSGSTSTSTERRSPSRSRDPDRDDDRDAPRSVDNDDLEERRRARQDRIRERRERIAKGDDGDRPRRPDEDDPDLDDGYEDDPDLDDGYEDEDDRYDELVPEDVPGLDDFQDLQPPGMPDELPMMMDPGMDPTLFDPE